MERKHTEDRVFKLVLVSLMIAMTLVINRLVPATPVYHLTVDFVPVFIVAVLFGPIWAAATYGIADAIGAILFPVGPFNPGITFTLMVLGFALGLVYYKKDKNGKWIWGRAFFASVAALIIKLLGTTYFLFLTYGGPDGMGYWAYVMARIPNCLMFAALMFVLLPVVQKVIIERIKIYR